MAPSRRVAVVETMLRSIMRYGLLVIALLLFFAWIGAFLVFHIVGALIHIVLVLAIIFFIVHLCSSRRAA